MVCTAHDRHMKTKQPSSVCRCQQVLLSKHAAMVRPVRLAMTQHSRYHNLSLGRNLGRELGLGLALAGLGLGAEQALLRRGCSHHNPQPP